MVKNAECAHMRKPCGQEKGFTPVQKNRRLGSLSMKVIIPDRPDSLQNFSKDWSLQSDCRVQQFGQIKYRGTVCFSLVFNNQHRTSGKTFTAATTKLQYFHKDIIILLLFHRNHATFLSHLSQYCLILGSRGVVPSYYQFFHISFNQLLMHLREISCKALLSMCIVSSIKIYNRFNTAWGEKKLK